MTDTVTAAVITVGGMIVVAVASVVTQLFTTRFVVKAEQRKTIQQIQMERRSRVLEKRQDRLTDVLAELLAESDPQVNSAFAFDRVVALVHRAQLVLDRTRDHEADLCQAINELGLELQSYIPLHQKPLEKRLVELQSLLKAHARVADLGGKLLARAT